MPFEPGLAEKLLREVYSETLNLETPPTPDEFVVDAMDVLSRMFPEQRKEAMQKLRIEYDARFANNQTTST